MANALTGLNPTTRIKPGSIQTQALAFLAVFVYATHATQAIAFEWKPGLMNNCIREGTKSVLVVVGMSARFCISFLVDVTFTSLRL